MIPNFVPVPKPDADADLALLLQHRPAMISGMFDSIAGHYDDLDRLLSIGLDERWRRHMVDALALGGHDVTDDEQQSTDEYSWFRNDRSDLERHKDGLTLDGQAFQL